jgi:hypothetical protein
LMPDRPHPASTTVAPLRADKDRILRQRLVRPAQLGVDEVEVVPVMEPARGSKPSRLGVGYGVNAELGGFAHLSGAIFSWDGIGNNGLRGSELVVMDWSAYAPSEGLVLDRLDFIRARKVTVNRARIHGESDLSWETALGLRREDRACESCNEWYGSFGIGRSREFGNRFTGQAMLGGTLDSRGDQSWISPSLALHYTDGSRWAGEIRTAWERSLDGDTHRLAWTAAGRYSLTANTEVRLAAAHQDVSEASLSVSASW